jgi:hypothetical protein
MAKQHSKVYTKVNNLFKIFWGKFLVSFFKVKASMARKSFQSIGIYIFTQSKEAF